MLEHQQVTEHLGSDDGSIRAVVFEPAGVLFDPTPRRRWLWQMVTRLGLKIAYDELVRPWDENYLPAVHRAECSYASALHAFLATLPLVPADLSELEAAITPRSLPLEAGLRLLPGVTRVLNRLSSDGLQLAVLSDSSLSGNELKEQFDCLAIGGRFDAVVTSAELGQVKPSRTNYQATSESLGLHPHECVMVSGAVRDLWGARGCGWRTIGCGAFKPEDADVRIGSILQLSAVISQWNCGRVGAAS